MGEDIAASGTRTHLRRLAMAVALLVAATLIHLGLGMDVPPPARQPRPIAAVHTLRGNRGPKLVTTTTAAPVPPTSVAPPVIEAVAPVAPVVEPGTSPAVAEPTVAKVAPAEPTGLDGWVRRPDLEEDLFARHNEARAAAGLAPYGEQSCLRSVAVRWARSMAERSALEHNPNYANQIVQCSDDVLVGENVGVGYVESGGAAGVFDAFMASPTHRSNILDTDFQLMGIGVWSSPDGTIRVAVNFGLQ